MRAFKLFVAIGLNVPAWTVFGQAFNLDFGGSAATQPASGYGAGGSQTGFWETASFGNLRDTSGQLTGVVMPINGGSALSTTIPGASGNDKLLMESVLAFGGTGSSFVLQHVNPGQYECYIYSWGGTNSGIHTISFRVFNGSSDNTGSVSYGGGWPGGQVLGATYCRVPVTVLPSFQIVGVQMFFSGDFDIVNGFQLVPVPAPGMGGVMLFGGMLAARRRR